MIRLTRTFSRFLMRARHKIFVFFMPRLASVGTSVCIKFHFSSSSCTFDARYEAHGEAFSGSGMSEKPAVHNPSPAASIHLCLGPEFSVSRSSCVSEENNETLSKLQPLDEVALLVFTFYCLCSFLMKQGSCINDVKVKGKKIL